MAMARLYAKQGVTELNFSFL